MLSPTEGHGFLAGKLTSPNLFVEILIRVARPPIAGDLVFLA
jgi:hypothetical protein